MGLELYVKVPRMMNEMQTKMTEIVAMTIMMIKVRLQKTNVTI